MRSISAGKENSHDKNLAIAHETVEPKITEEYSILENSKEDILPRRSFLLEFCAEVSGKIWWKVQIPPEATGLAEN